MTQPIVELPKFTQLQAEIDDKRPRDAPPNMARDGTEDRPRDQGREHARYDETPTSKQIVQPKFSVTDAQSARDENR